MNSGSFQIFDMSTVTFAGDPCGRIRKKLKEGKAEGDP